MTKFKINDLVKHKHNEDLYGIVIVVKHKLEILMIGKRKYYNHTGKMYNAYEIMEEFWTVL